MEPVPIVPTAAEVRATCGHAWRFVWIEMDGRPQCQTAEEYECVHCGARKPITDCLHYPPFSKQQTLTHVIEKDF